jgi:hypothetical protein
VVGKSVFGWIWLVDLLVRFVRELIERLVDSENPGDKAKADAIKLAASHVLDPSRPEDRIV